MSSYVHNVPGRIRVKIPILRNNKESALEIQAILDDIEGVQEVSVNTVSGSIVVRYDFEILGHWEILEVLEDNGYFDISYLEANDSHFKRRRSKAGEAVGKALFGWAIGKAFEGSSLSILTAFI